VTAIKQFEATLTAKQLKVLSGLTSPWKIQQFLDSIPYSSEEVYRCPASVLRDNKGHCFDGALFAAAALRRLGYPPLIVYMIAVRDDDHLLAVYQRNGAWGTVAKSNCVGLRYREPIYRSLRELVMSYFDDYFSTEGVKTLRGYTVPIDLAQYDPLHWMTSDENLEIIADGLDKRRKFKLLTEDRIASLAPVDKRSYDAGFLGSDWAGLYDPKKHDGRESTA
jgi:hypothetical protein